MEIDLFLSNKFGFDSQYSHKNYAYGTYKEAIPFKNIENVSFGDDLLERLKIELLGSGLSRNNRRLLLKKFSKKKNLRDHFRNMSDDRFNELIKNTHIDENKRDFYNDIIDFLDRDRFVDFLTGTKREKIRIFSEFIDYIFSFKKLVNVYSQIFPDIVKLSTLPEKSFKNMESTILHGRILQNIFPKKIIKLENLKNAIVKNFSDSIRSKLDLIIKKNKLGISNRDELFLDSDLVSIPINYTTVLFGVEYARRHVYVNKRARKPKIGDIIDLYNLKNLPYVDLFLTDSFIAEMVNKTAYPEYGTKVFKNLIQLSEFLEKHVVSNNN